MRFEYNAYQKMITKLKDQGYSFTNYENWPESGRCVILRHDIDFSIEKAIPIAEIENELEVGSTFFVLLSTGLYNVFSGRNLEILDRICKLGHTIGLHFDETVYYAKNVDIVDAIVSEATMLSSGLKRDIKVVSMHRPSKKMITSELVIPNMINAYSQIYCGGEFKYLSDSRRRWREPVDDIIDCGEYSRLHILTHPFWYAEQENSLRYTIEQYILSANLDRYDLFDENFTELSAVLRREEVMLSEGNE